MELTDVQEFCCRVACIGHIDINMTNKIKKFALSDTKWQQTYKNRHLNYYRSILQTDNCKVMPGSADQINMESCFDRLNS